MIVNKFDINKYKIPFIKPLKTSNRIFKEREGIWLKITSNEICGLGEAAPLPGFSNESLTEVRYALEGINLALEGEDYDYEDLICLIKVHTENVPSARFALETAFFDLYSQKSNQKLAEFLNPNYKTQIKINGIEGIHLPTDNFRIIKIKVGYNNLFDEIDRMNYLTKSYGEGIGFRLDLNGILDLPKAIRFCKTMENYNIDYIEQPIEPNNIEDIAELRYHTDIPIAVDESLTDYKSAEKIIDMQAADVFVLKPMVSGGFVECKKIIELAQSEQIRTIISSSLETNIGLNACLHLAAANEISDHCGLGTGALLQESNINNQIRGEIVSMPKDAGLGIKLNI